MIKPQSLQDTICALATPVGEGGIGIVKISGPDSLHIARKIFRHRPPLDQYASHQLYYGTVIDPRTCTVVDEVLLSYMKAPRTYTREDIVEINCHSGPLVCKRILEIVLDAGARLAEPGEFTKRAFLNGRIDLTRAEAIIELIRTQSERGVELAAQHLEGKFHEKVEGWRDELIEIIARVEAAIDFPEEMGEEMPLDEIRTSLITKLLRPIEETLASYDSGRILKEGLKMVIVGKPNVGKSSLLNALLREDRAIVSAIPGTTRDTIEEAFSLNGIPVHIIDTAGLRKPGDSVEELGISRAKSFLSAADFVLFVVDASLPVEDEDLAIYSEIKEKEGIIVLNKCDLPKVVTSSMAKKRFPGFSVVSISVLKREGLDELEESIFEKIIREKISYDRSTLVPNLRHKKCLEAASQAIRRAIDLTSCTSSPELISFELNESLQKLGEIIGETVTEDILDHIFSQFCIGK